MKYLSNHKMLWVLALVFTVFYSCSDDNDTVSSMVDFEDLPISENSHYGGTAPTVIQTGTSQALGGVSFNYNYTTSTYGDYWGGCTYSNMHDATTAGYTNQFSVADGDNGNNTFLLAFDGGNVISFLSDEARIVHSMKLCLNTFAALAIKNGSSDFSEPFAAGDYFVLNVTGVYADERASDTVKIYLADYRDGKTDILNKWTSYSDFALLGAVKGLKFDFESTDIGQWGINTPKYCCIDDIVYE